MLLLAPEEDMRPAGCMQGRFSAGQAVHREGSEGQSEAPGLAEHTALPGAHLLCSECPPLLSEAQRGGGRARCR